jgi:ATP-dependent Clp protease ATP-binding subunit ClpA
MFERFTRSSRRVIEVAQAAASRLGAEQVEPEHVLLALAGGWQDPAAPALAGGCHDPAALALAEVGVDAGTIAQAIEDDLVAMLEVVGVPPSVVAATPPHPRHDRPSLSAATKQVLEHALQEAVSRRDRRLDTEHLLLGVLRPPAATVRRVLFRLDVDPERLAALVQVEAAARR